MKDTIYAEKMTSAERSRAKLPRPSKRVAVSFLIGIGYLIGFGIFSYLYALERPGRNVESQVIGITPLNLGIMLWHGRDISERIFGALTVLTMSASGLLCYWLMSGLWQFLVMFAALAAAIWMPFLVWMHRRTPSVRSVPAELRH